MATAWLAVSPLSVVFADPKEMEYVVVPPVVPPVVLPPFPNGPEGCVGIVCGVFADTSMPLGSMEVEPPVPNAVTTACAAALPPCRIVTAWLAVSPLSVAGAIV